jgi:hypothetical protein
MHRPAFIYDMCVARTAAEFLHGELGVEAFAKKYAEMLSDGCVTVNQEEVQAPAEAMLQFLAEVEAGEGAADLLNSFAYFRLNFEGVGRPRKMKPMFGNIEDPVKAREWNKESTPKAFRAFVFALRSQTVPTAPAGWQLETEEAVPKLAEAAAKKLSVLDMF